MEQKVPVQQIVALFVLLEGEGALETKKAA